MNLDAKKAKKRRCVSLSPKTGRPCLSSEGHLERHAFRLTIAGVMRIYTWDDSGNEEVKETLV